MALTLFLVTLMPLAALVLLGAPGVASLLGAPTWVAATLRTLLLAEAAVPVALCLGFAGALGIWGAPRGPRLGVVAVAILPLLMPQHWTAAGLLYLADHAGWHGAHLAALVAVHAAPGTSLAFLVFCAAFNEIDPAWVETASANAGPMRAWRLVAWPKLAAPALTASCVAFAASIGASAADSLLAPPYHPTLGTMISVAAGTGDVRLAPAALIMAALAMAPLPLLVIARRKQS